MTAMRTATIVLWYGDAIVYEVRLCCDSDGRGYSIAGSTDIHPASGTLREVRAPYALCDAEESGKSHRRSTAI